MIYETNELQEKTDKNIKELGIKLEPCPFCGGTDIHISPVIDTDGEEVNREIVCYDCLASFRVSDALTMNELVNGWNRRTNIQAYWIRNSIGGYTCSNCKNMSSMRRPYCDECGAKMDGNTNNET